MAKDMLEESRDKRLDKGRFYSMAIKILLIPVVSFTLAFVYNLVRNWQIKKAAQERLQRVLQVFF